MEKQTATRVFETLSSGIRLDVYRLLVRCGSQGMVAGRIAWALDLPPANLSFHLKAMTQAGLLSVEQEGRFQRYRANLALMMEFVRYLTEECCAGHPEQCLELGAIAHGVNAPVRLKRFVKKAARG
jgi:ArsR family transcriptional regulator, arsenate/arsenite/antimonite-responsive transcriptional repressor